MAETKAKIDTTVEPWNFYDFPLNGEKYHLFQKRSKLDVRLKSQLPDYAIDCGWARLSTDNSHVETNIRVPETKLKEFLAWLTERGIPALVSSVPFGTSTRYPVFPSPAFDKWTFESRPFEDASQRRPPQRDGLEISSAKTKPSVSMSSTTTSASINKLPQTVVTDSTVVDDEQDAKIKQTRPIESGKMEQALAQKLRKHENVIIEASKIGDSDKRKLETISTILKKRFANRPSAVVSSDSGRTIEAAIVAPCPEMAASIVKKLGHVVVGIQMVESNEFRHLAKCRGGTFMRMMAKDCATKKDRDFYFDLTEYEREFNQEVAKVTWQSEDIGSPLDVATFSQYNTVVLDPVDGKSDSKVKDAKHGQVSTDVPLQPGQRKCAHCNVVMDIKVRKIMQCGRCKKAHYCSPACQGNDWVKHKPDCRQDTRSIAHIDDADIARASRVVEPNTPFVSPHGFIGRGTKGSSSKTEYRHSFATKSKRDQEMDDYLRETTRIQLQGTPSLEKLGDEWGLLKAKEQAKEQAQEQCETKTTMKCESTQAQEQCEAKTTVKGESTLDTDLNTQLPTAASCKSPMEFMQSVLQKDRRDFMSQFETAQQDMLRVQKEGAGMYGAEDLVKKVADKHQEESRCKWMASVAYNSPSMFGREAVLTRYMNKIADQSIKEQARLRAEYACQYDDAVAKGRALLIAQFEKRQGQ